MNRTRRAAAVLATLCVLMLTGVPANAASSSNSFNVPYGQLFVSAWECSTFIDKCSWYTKVQLRYNGGRVMDRITNTTKVDALGFSASVTISKNSPSATLTGNRTGLATIRWTKYRSNLVELSGTADPSWLAIGISTQACLTGNGPGGYGDVSAKCAKIGLW